jgi:predicted transcriptional regulator
MGKRKTQAERILAYVRRRPKSGATRKELCANLGILHQSVGPRVVELLEAGLVVETKQVRDDSLVLRARGRR